MRKATWNCGTKGFDMFWLRIQLIWGDLLWGLPQTGGPSCGGFTREIMNETIVWRTGFSKFDLSIQPISTCLFLWGMSGCRKLTNVANAAAISGLHIGNKGIEMPYVVDASRCLMSGWNYLELLPTGKHLQQLQVERYTNPIGTLSTQPFLKWRLQSMNSITYNTIMVYVKYQ